MASTSSFRASSSSSTPSIPRTTTYDVFLSFRGEDTRYNFTDHLYSALGRRGIRTFRDDRLRRGEAIAPELLKAIEESRSSVIVFSENYAHSRWCLDELVKIMECHKDLGHDVFPIFYHVDPSHVRKQEGSFGEAFAGYEENWKDKIPRWRTALTEAANLSGWHLLDGYESNQIKEITNSIFRRLKCKRLDAGANLVGIDSRVEEMILRLHMESSDVRIVGIYGVGGIGKTTIAKVIYNKLSCEFECMSFLEDIREKFNTQGVSPLQNQLLDDILMEEGSQNINGVAHKASMIEAILLAKRAFIVLDDVDDVDQLEYLLRNHGWLGKGSRVIITTRNKHVLTHQEVDDLYEVKELNSEEACELFSLYAFKQNLPKSVYRNLSCRVVGYCQGLPLALKVLGSLLFNKTIPQWESELTKLDKEPEMKIHNVLKRSYDRLDRTEKNIFLDVACFFKGEDRDFVSRILDGCDFHAERGIRNLNDLCLITLPHNQISMHDLIQQMGWEIVREKFPDEPNKWSRLWDPCDFERALTAYEGIEGIETISLDLSKLKRVCSNSDAFTKMNSLRLLKVHSSSDIDSVYKDIRKDIEEEVYDVVMKNASKMQLGQGFKFPSYKLRYLRWDGYPLDFLPSNFDGGKLVELHLNCSNIKQLWQGNKDLERLKVIDLSYSRKLSQMSEFSSMPNLERLFLRGCVSLIDIHPSVGNMKKLTTLRLRSCNKLKNLPDSIGDLESLEILDLCYCSNFEKFPEKGGNMKSLRELHLEKTAIKDLPDSIGDLESLELLSLFACSKFEKFPEKGGNMKSLRKLDFRFTAIKDLPDSIGDLESLELLSLFGCSKFKKFPEKGGNMKSLRELDLKNTAIKDLPDSIGDLESLEILSLSNCSKFEKFPEKGGNMKSLRELDLKNTAIKDLPDSIGDLESLEILSLSNCSKFEKFPEKGGNMKSLTHLYLENTAIKDLPDSIGDLESLEFLSLSNCSKFEKFPEKGGNMKSLLDLELKNTAIKDLPESIGDLEFLRFLSLSNRLKFEKFPLSLDAIDAHLCTKRKDLSRLLWLCHLNWLKSTTEEFKSWKLSAFIPERSGIPKWIKYQTLGRVARAKLPINWCEDPDFPGFVLSCVYRPSPDYHRADKFHHDIWCELEFYGNGFRFRDSCFHFCACDCHVNFKDSRGLVCVCWYPKAAIPEEHHHKYTRVNAFFTSLLERDKIEIIKCGINVIVAGDQRNHMPMLEHPQNSGDNGSALQDTNGNAHGANQDDEHYHIPKLDLLGNFHDNGSAVLEDTLGNCKRRRDDSLPDVVEEPHYKKIGSTQHRSLALNSITSTNQNEITCGSCWSSLCFFPSTCWWKRKNNEEKLISRCK
uniref:ADP-ribosyl cyclase/cyclic ADP-ribose hydrolase n=1 Tax=Vitis rotundifolia TaxID=103349 RepID=V9M396_VITRO|nr:TIR-NB-LRR type resistance protein RGA1 [Vitis rotundifolia]